MAGRRSRALAESTKTQSSETHSKYYATVKKWHDLGMWPDSAVRSAVKKGWITQAECDEILGA